jgi:hypothetical protein
MYIIAITFVVCDVLVVAIEGVDGMPFGIWGLLGSFVFIAAALLMAQYVKRQPH